MEIMFLRGCYVLENSPSPVSVIKTVCMETQIPLSTSIMQCIMWALVADRNFSTVSMPGSGKQRHDTLTFLNSQ